ncbi:hypothetical protein [Virgibacillus halodenitrificans]|uniref:hypothetical protein n=1 Tax=Virgibacillus halodenitrificans TaxID=1482 RepID=UPI0013CEA8B6|nr:hypothetical protein [Virgibacillus halodenitrificans]
MEPKSRGKPIIKRVLFLATLFIAFFPSIAFAASQEESYEYMNKILTIAVVIGGFLVITSIIASGIRLATAQSNPQNRTAGIIGLVFAFFGGYMVYKAIDIAGWLSGITGL